MRKVLEKARQSLRVGEKEFTPTPNVRNPAMLEEAEAFSKHMLGFKRSLRIYQVEMAGFLKMLPVINKGNLPRVWEKVEGGLCEPIRPSVSHDHPIRIGGDFDPILLRDTRDIVDRRIENDIIRPIDRWLEGIAVVKDRMSKLDRLRLDVDARRRRMMVQYKRSLRRLERHAGINPDDPDNLGAVESRSTSRIGTPYDPLSSSDEDEHTPGAQRTREDVVREALYYQRKLEAVQASYNEQEQLVWEQLAGLVRDAAWLKSYMAGAFLVVKEALQAAAVALGPCKQPLPGYGLEVSSANEYGAMGENGSLIASVPSAAERQRATTQAPRPFSGLPFEVRPSRATAQPLQVAADDRITPRYDTVPPVSRGMADVPVDSNAYRSAGLDSPAKGSNAHDAGLLQRIAQSAATTFLPTSNAATARV
ncbi:MAG: hypothetical protein WDW38_005358 [Sanguina aurantia]